MTDNLSKTIQNESFCAIDGQSSADLTLQALKGIRTEVVAKLFYENIVKKATKSQFYYSQSTMILLMMTLCVLSTKNMVGTYWEHRHTWLVDSLVIQGW